MCHLAEQVTAFDRCDQSRGEFHHVSVG
jgi:hypothetical protein